MSTCSDICAQVLRPSVGDTGCGNKTRPGGLIRFIIATCGACLTAQPYEDGTLNMAAFADLVAQCKIRISAPGEGSKGEPEDTDLRLYSCSGEQTISRVHPFEFIWRDFSRSNTEFEFLEQVEANPSNYKIGFVACADEDGIERFYGFLPLYRFKAPHIIPATSEEIQQFSISAAVKKRGQIIPMETPGLSAYLAQYASFDCASGEYVGSGAPEQPDADLLGLQLCA